MFNIDTFKNMLPNQQVNVIEHLLDNIENDNYKFYVLNVLKRVIKCQEMNLLQPLYEAVEEMNRNKENI
jgi:F0F1-type ATP synthase delta subunit